MEKKLDGSYTRMLQGILDKSWRQYPTKQQLYGHLPPITKTIKVRRTRHVGNCSRSKDELISNILQWTPSHGRAKAGRPARTYIQQLCVNTGYSLEDPSQEQWMIEMGGERGSENSSPRKQQKLHKFVLTNYKLKLREIDEELKILEGSVFTILDEHLLMRKLFKVVAAFAYSQSKTEMH